MPMSVATRAGYPDYGNPFVGPVQHTVPVAVPIADLTADEVDARGYLKPGVPLTLAGALVAAMTRSTLGSPAAGGSNVGDGTVGSVVGGWGAPTETITLTCISEAANAGTFRVEGSKSGVIGVATVAVPFVSPIINFTIADGATDFDIGDTFTIAATAGALDRVHGCVVEAVKVAASNSDTDRTAAGTVPVVVATHGLVNRDLLEDILGRALTASEIAGFAGSNLTLTTT